MFLCSFRLYRTMFQVVSHYDLAVVSSATAKDEWPLIAAHQEAVPSRERAERAERGADAVRTWD